MGHEGGRLIRTYPDPVLRRRSRPVEPGGPEAKEAARLLREAFDPATALGLAAPQVGVSARVVLVRLDAEERVLLNPEIKERSQELVVESEGCLSLPGVEAEVARAQEVMIQAQDEEGQPIELRLDGLQARLLQHEVDHLDGVLYIDHLAASDRRRVLREYRAARAAGKGPTSSAL